MRQIILIGLLLIASSYIVRPKTDACECSSLLSQSDCISKTGCKWKYITITISTTQSPTPSTTLGSCSNDTNTAIVQTFCSTIMDSTQCSSSIGCAFYNDTCTIFAGCSAYAKTTNSACQAISIQCTTDGFGCILPTACQNYKTEELCTKNLALSRAKSCNWMNNDNGGTCEDKKCSDAPSSFKTLSSCNNWIAGCQTNGIECVSTVSSCSQYQYSNGCIGMIGSEGPCIASTASKSCRALVCTDAPSTYSTDTACDNFLKGCLTFGRGCVLFLSPCNTNLQSQGCTDLIGSDGPCNNRIQYLQIISMQRCSIYHQQFLETLYYYSTNTNADCSKFLSGCVTTGQGCTNQLSTCSSYQGTKISCSSYIGTDGKCKGISAQSDSCLARTCQDAPVTTNTNSACSSFQLGCVTTGAGCTSTLDSCTSYIGTNITCPQYIGNDGNCTAPQTQTTPGACYPKICSDAPTYITKNSECQAYSYLCVTNGAGCTRQRSCEATSSAITCKEQQSCSLNQICLNRSSCGYYQTQSQCLLNQQQYSNQKIIYLRPCQWIEKTQTCTNVLCSSLSITLITDADCNSALSGCITNGAGCVDMSDPCSSYQGLTKECQRFKGVNGIIQCSQLNTIIDPTTPCVAITKCSQIKDLSLFPQTSATCQQISPGCFFDGKDNCTSLDCTTYFGTQYDCSFISSAIVSDINYNTQKCWKTVNLSDPATPCEKRLCSHAPSYLTNDQYDKFLDGCIWNGLDQGGCMEKLYSCNEYKGTFSRCSAITTKSGAKCTKTNKFCKPVVCVDKIPPTSASTNILQGTYCQQFIENSFNYNCQMGSGGVQTCVSPDPKSCALFVAIGNDKAQKAYYCQALNYPGQVGCGYSAGDYCNYADCDQFTSQGQTVDQKVNYCQGLKVDGTYVQCGLASFTATQCSVRKCTDYGITQSQCNTYSTNCVWNELASYCYTKADCTNYLIPASFTTTDLSKARFCSSLISNAVNFKKCAYLFDTSTTTCNQTPYHCTDISMPSAIKSDVDKINFCLNSISVNNDRCAYSTDRPTTCSDIALCHKYIPYQKPQSDLVNQTFCSKMIDYYKRVCGFTTGINQCLQAQANCSDYDTYGKSIADNQAFCSQLTETTNNKKCASNKSGISKCKDPTCGDITQGQSFPTCNLYNNLCTFDGKVCVTIIADCTGYNAQDIGQGQQVNCAQLIQIDGKKCGWTSGLNCNSRICSQLKGAGASAVSCAAYAQDCQYDGQSCVDQKEDCKLYIPQGETDAIKASICNAMNSKNSENSYTQICTYVAGQPTCEFAWGECYNRIPYGMSNEQGLAICSLVQNSSGFQCGFNEGYYQCDRKRCSQALISKSDSDCNNYQKGCEIDSNTSCDYDYSDYISCYAAPKTLTTDAACKSYNIYCLTNGAGCVDRWAMCSAYKGNQTQCNRFIGYYGSYPCSNTANASETDQCIDKTCASNLTAKSDSECDIWYPRYFPWRRECVWGGGLGCQSSYDTCDKFIGTVDSCPTFLSLYGPCFGTGSVAKPAPCAPTSSQCTAAPKTYNSNELCQKWGSSCIFDGIGCISSFGFNCSSLQTLQVCSLNKAKYGCDLALSCKSTSSTCDDFNNAVECNNTQQGLYDLKCGWDAFKKKCVPINCSLLPLTLVTDIQCSAAIPTCTAGGIGCITKGACSTYPKLACGVASSTDIQKACIWQNSACRPIECTDNTIATTDADCNKFLAGCRNLGMGCLSNITCSQITKASLCLFDSVGYPCLWYKPSTTSTGSCVNYAKCSDIISSSHQECQSASPLCTTNGSNCIAITSCSKTLLQASCMIGTDGQCGWRPATSSIPANCQLYTNCQSAQGTSNEQCYLWGQKCISDGKFCIEKSTCATFSTQDSCLIGTDGICFWVQPNEKSHAFCRIQICLDATTNITSHSGCLAFQASSPCTTSGIQCIPQAYCSSYESKAGCFQGTDGVCWWATSLSPTMSTSLCRLKQCTDSSQTQSALCKQEIPSLKCVSDGISCIPQSTCSSYSSREACLGGGSDGVCAFNSGANTTTPNIGTCQLFTQCSNANSDQIACNSRSDACYFNLTIVNGIITSQCIPHTCATKAQGSSCQPVPSWDLSSYQICVLSGTICREGNPNELTAQNCYNNSAGTFTWNVNTSVCSACQAKITINNDSIDGYLISIILVIVSIF